MLTVIRTVWNCDGVNIGSIVRNEDGGTFFLQRKEVERLGDARDMGINFRYMMGQRESTPLKRAFA